jgi:hypothetical protein
MKRERMGECEVMRDEMTTRCPHSASTAAPTACSVCAPALSSVRAVCCLLGLGDGNVPKAREEWKKSRPRVGPRSECPRYRGNSFSFSFLPRDFCDGGIDRSTDSIWGWQQGRRHETAKRALYSPASSYRNRRWARLGNRVRRTGSRSVT